MRETEVAVVGAGPAGLAAAAEASRAGARVMVLDEYAAPGGQYMRARRPGGPEPHGEAVHAPHRLREGLLGELKPGRVEILTGTTVWGAFGDNLLGLYREGRAEFLRWKRLVVASGAHDRPIAFPGWTLPGVITPGAAQVLVKGQGVLPGRRVLLAGSGPFLLPVAVELIAAGAQVVALLEATRPRHWWPHVLGGLGHWDRAREGMEYWRTVREAGVPVRFGHVVAEVRGRERVEEAVIVRVDREWRPIPGTGETVAVDAVCVGYGFLPATDLTRLLGCAHRFDDVRGGWIPAHDAQMRTSLREVFVAGDVAGIGGASAALYAGRMAGIAAAADLGHLSEMEAVRRAAPHHEAYQRARAFGDMVVKMFAVRPGIYSLMRDDTIVCRCEEITLARLRASLDGGDHNMTSLKGSARPGMGLCQGRTCGRMTAGVVATLTGRGEESLGMLTARAPLRPVPVEVLAAMPLVEQRAPVPEHGPADAPRPGK